MSGSGTATPGSQYDGSGRPETPSRLPSGLRNEIGSPASPGSEEYGYDSQSFSEGFAPGILASRLGRSLAGAGVGSSLSLTGSGSSSPGLALTGFNAISTVLNNPSKRQQPIDPKSSRFPPLSPTPHVLSDIPKAKKADIEGYLSTVRPEWDRFMRNQKLGRQGKATVGEDRETDGSGGTAPAPNDTDSATSTNTSPAKKRGHRARGSVASLSADLRAQPALAPKKRLPPLSAVPQVFFSEEFDLGNPYTFDLVTERYKATASGEDGPAAPNYDVALNQMLQEKLSYYSDVIEQHLVIEIGQQSSSFFAALGNLKDLNAEAESCLDKIGQLKSELSSIDENQAKAGLRIVQQHERRRQLQGKRKAIESMREVVERRDLASLLVQQGETEEALEVIDGLRRVLTAGETSPAGMLRFAELQSLSFILPQLSELESSLSGSLQRDLIAILSEDLASRTADAAQADGREASEGYFAQQLSSIPSASPTSTPQAGLSLPLVAKPAASPFGNASRPLAAGDDQLRSRIAPLVGGLVRTNGIDGLVTAYREAALQAIKRTWRAELTDAAGSEEGWEELATYLETEDPAKNDLVGAPDVVLRFRDASHDTFLALGRKLFESLLRCLKGIDSQAKLVVRILDDYHRTNSRSVVGATEDPTRNGTGSPHADAGDSPNSAPHMPDGVSPSLPATMADIVTASTELSHVLTARLIAVRSSVHPAMDLALFLAVFQLCWAYILSSELVSRKMIVGLRGSVLSQAKGFLSHFHRKRIERAAKAVEEETWAQSEVGADVQREVRLIVESAVEDPAAFVVTGDARRSFSEGGTKDATEVGNADGEAVAPAKALEIEDRSYFVVSASLDVLKLLADYLRVIINLPLLTTEAMGRVVEFLKQFNSRTCQVVLGAGAMRSAGLKNITAKHLALASQSLSIMISLIPYIRETVRRHLSPKQAVMLTEFDKLRRDFQEHQYEIHAKLVAIMSDRLTVHCRSLGAVEWNAPLAGGDGEGTVEANRYASDLAKETATLHKVLSKYLQPPVVEHVIGQVLKAIDLRISAELEKVDVQTPAARRRMEEDISLLETKLSTLKHVTWTGSGLNAVLEQKKAATAEQAAAENKTEAPPAEPQQQQQPPVQQHAYKPRIPSLFARRQQQQHQQQQQQQQYQQQQSAQNSPVRTSVDSGGRPATPLARPSHEATPRSSLQDIVVPPVPNKDASASGTDSATAEADGEASEPVPPTPPAKSVAPTEPAAEDAPPESVQPQPVQPDADAATTEKDSTELPTVPAPTAEEEPAKESATPGVSAAEPPAAAPTRTAEDESKPEQSAEAVSEALNAPAAAEEVESQSGAAAEVTVKTDQETGSSIAETSTTPPVIAASAHPAGTFDIASPTRSGASTPASASANNTPSKPPRMSLKERLAEAARKRSMAQQASAPAPAAAPPAAAESAQQDRSSVDGVATAPEGRSEVAKAPADGEVSKAEVKTEGAAADGAATGDAASNAQPAALASASEAAPSKPVTNAEPVDAQDQTNVAQSAESQDGDAKKETPSTDAVGEVSAKENGDATDQDKRDTEGPLQAAETLSVTAADASTLSSGPDATTEEAAIDATPSSPSAEPALAPAAEATIAPTNAAAGASSTAEPASTPIEADSTSRKTTTEGPKTDAAEAGEANEPAASGTATPDVEGSVRGDVEGEGEGDNDEEGDGNATPDAQPANGVTGGGGGGGTGGAKKKKKKGKKKK